MQPVFGRVEFMATVHFNSEPTTTAGELPAIGQPLPEFSLVGTDLSEVSKSDFAGKRLVINIFPSLDTGICAQSVREFNKLAEQFENTVVVCVSKDLPFAQDRFCGAEGIENVVVASAFRSSFGEDFGVTLQGSPLEGLLSRSVVVTDEDHNVIYNQLLEEIKTEPDYQAAADALK